MAYNRAETSWTGAIMDMPDTKPEIKTVLSAKEAGNLLGVTGKTVIRLAEDGDLPAYKIGNSWRFKRIDVEAYLEAHRYQPQKPEEH